MNFGSVKDADQFTTYSTKFATTASTMKEKTMKRTKTSSTYTEHKIEINPKDLRNYLKSKGIQVPNDAIFSVHVPGGWSYSDPELSEDIPIEVKWSVTTDDDS